MPKKAKKCAGTSADCGYRSSSLQEALFRLPSPPEDRRRQAPAAARPRSRASKRKALTKRGKPKTRAAGALGTGLYSVSDLARFLRTTHARVSRLAVAMGLTKRLPGFGQDKFPRYELMTRDQAKALIGAYRVGKVAFRDIIVW